jgi:hypothetical protein
MEGLETLLNLPAEILEKISEEYGTVFRLYRKIFDLNNEQYKLMGSGSPRLEEIKNELLDIEDSLEEYGVEDGRDITTEIASDFAEIIVNRRINGLDKYLEQFGTDFNTMRDWLKDKYGL